MTKITYITHNNENHTIACFKSDRIEIDHHSYETSEWTRIKNWCDSFEKKGIQLKWGPGRHGPGNNLFIFVSDVGCWRRFSFYRLGRPGGMGRKKTVSRKIVFLSKH